MRRSRSMPVFVVLTLACAGSGGPAGIVPSLTTPPTAGHAHIVGVVTTERGAPFAHSDLRLWRFRGQDTLVRAERQVADSAGGFAFRNMAPGDYLIEAHFIGAHPAWVRARARPDGVDTVRIPLRQAEVVVYH